LWTEESVTYHSETCQLDNVRMNLRPVQKPHPPIWIAANNDRAIERAARMSDAWMINPHSTLETIRRHMTIYENALTASGRSRPAELPVIKEVFCAKDRATALEMAGPYLMGKYKDYAKWGQDKAMPENETFDQEFDDLIAGRFILGSPDECYEQLRPYWEEFGVNHLLIRTHWAGMPLSTALHSLRMISNELLPALQSV
ncbi:MAG TPA: LLM class flavin-dependent oxidoreductase, partial [Arenicellales bacterium]|nr:LLM class flavin-dependent oxidoreductase [Arenicellales bacterium]